MNAGSVSHKNLSLEQRLNLDACECSAFNKALGTANQNKIKYSHPWRISHSCPADKHPYSPTSSPTRTIPPIQASGPVERQHPSSYKTNSRCSSVSAARARRQPTAAVPPYFTCTHPPPPQQRGTVYHYAWHRRTHHRSALALLVHSFIAGRLIKYLHGLAAHQGGPASCCVEHIVDTRSQIQSRSEKARSNVNLVREGLLFRYL